MAGDLQRDPAALTALLQCSNAARRTGAPDAAAESAVETAFAASRRLAVYGTLVPGGSNHHLVAPLGGDWQPGTVRGRRTMRTFPAFTWDERDAPVAVMLLTADGLPAAWARLDEFERPDYVRVLVPVRLRDGALAVANLYEPWLPVPPIGTTTGHSA
jgi:gamma-glutamylcyclotransferase (GGCT)/AIG2-like uncharacterized protein YtfP